MLWVALVGAVFPLTIDRAYAYDYWENVLRVISTPRLFSLIGWVLLPALVPYLAIGVIVWIVRGFKRGPAPHP